MIRNLKVFLVLALGFCWTYSLHAMPQRSQSSYVPPQDQEERMLFLISDTHMGFGKDANSQWLPIEDFRWPKALSSFLEMVRSHSNDKADLIIVGDFFEMWQVPHSFTCTDGGHDLGCTIAEMTEIARNIAAAHSQELADLTEFSQAGENRLHILPGNHDAAFLIQDVWEPIGQALNDASGRVNLVTEGLWVSPDGKIVIEHGHQIGSDVNRYENWPEIVVSEDSSGVYRMIRPWGENFVQSIFNEIEAGSDNAPSYAVIDNLAPESSAIRYRISDVGFQQTAREIAQFLAFNLFETSLSQKVSFLGPQKFDEHGKPIADIKVGRQLGHRLFVEALDENDPFRKQLMSNNAKAAEIRKELDALAGDEQRLSDAEVSALCDLLVIRNSSEVCWDATLGMIFQGVLFSDDHVLKEHLIDRWSSYRDMVIFVYGHTHKYKVPRDVYLFDDRVVSVANTGAFQRVIDDQAFLDRVSVMTRDENYEVTPGEALRRMKLDQLAPCYTFIEITYEDGIPRSELNYWIHSEDEMENPSRVRIAEGSSEERCR
ncbi:metallophosphoesterase [Thalassospira sp.]|uniref:metallophosphoesterase n=1 Tax=Thalassospira sp. TaxID=1912094 RepID=UPI0032EF2A83